MTGASRTIYGNQFDLLLIALSGLAVGGVSRMAGRLFVNVDAAPFALIVGGATVIVLWGTRAGTTRHVQRDVAAWWIAVAVGTTLAFGGVPIGAFLLMGLFWAGSAECAIIRTRRLHDRAATSRATT